MDDDTSTDNTEISRRATLRSGAAVAAVSTFGLGTLTGTVSATRFCPRSPGYWIDHWHDKFGESVTIPPAGSLSKNQIQTLLKSPTRGDTVNIMAKQYVATYLNLLLRPDPDESCANVAVAVDGIGTVEWEHVKNSAQHWLRLNNWDGSVHWGKRDWTPTMTVEGATVEVDGEVLKDALDAFNNSAFDELSCNCSDTNGEDDEDMGGELTRIDGCTTITEPGHYALSADIEAGDDETCIKIEASNVVLDGRSYTINAGENGRRGVMAGELLSIDVENVTVKNLNVTGFEDAGIAYEDATGGEIRNVTVTRSQNGVEFLSVRDVTVSGSLFEQNERGVFLTDGSSDNTFTNNDIDSNTGTGVTVTEFSRDNGLRRNRITENGGSGIALNDGSSEPVLDRNMVRSNGEDGITLGDLTDATVAQNQTFDNGGDGIHLSEVDGSRLEKNISRRNGDDGIELVDSDDNKIIKNVVQDNDDEAIVITGTSSGNTLSGNVTK